MTQKANEFYGFSLFNDVDDAELRAYNRGRILVNIMEDNSKLVDGQNKISGKGALLCVGYFESIPPEERAAAKLQGEGILEKKKNGH